MGGMLGYLVVNQWGVNAWVGCALWSWSVAGAFG